MQFPAGGSSAEEELDLITEGDILILPASLFPIILILITVPYRSCLVLFMSITLLFFPLPHYHNL